PFDCIRPEPTTTWSMKNLTRLSQWRRPSGHTTMAREPPMSWRDVNDSLVHPVLGAVLGSWADSDAVMGQGSKGEATGRTVATWSIRGRLFRKYALAFATVVCIALITNGLVDIWFSYREQRDLLVRIQHGQAQAASAC